MYKKHKALMLILYGVMFTVSFFTCVQTNDNLLSAILTTLSITLGLTITSITALYGRPYTAKLSKTEDKCAPITQTQLHTLKCYFRTSAYMNVFHIIAILLYMIFREMLFNQAIWIVNILDAAIIAGVICCLIISLLLIRILINALEK